MRDDISTLPIPASGKRYARMKGLNILKGDHKFKAYSNMVADLTGNPRGFKAKSKDAVGKVKHTFGEASPIAKKLAGR